MNIATSVSTSPVSSDAVGEAWKALCARLGGRPHLVILTTTCGHAADEVVTAMDALVDGCPWVGGTSCQGLMTEEGVVLGEHVLGLWGILDHAGRYGVGSAELGDDARAAASVALDRALDDSDTLGEIPELVWLVGAPDREEDVLMGVRDVVGPSVPVVGGSTADDSVAGHWWQAHTGWHHGDGVVLVAMFPGAQVCSHYHMGYAPTARSARVTGAAGRTLQSLDGRPAAEVYDEWTGGAIAGQRAGGSVLMETTLFPLGREATGVGGVSTHVLLHPEAVEADGSLALFANVEEGEELVLMTGTRDSLLQRAGRVASMARSELVGGDLSGALAIYCAGCMLTVQDDMDVAVAGLREALGGAPFLGAFTFGEQGHIEGGGNRHGNLMISVVTLGSRSSA